MGPERRICVEFLPPAELLRRDVVDLLAAAAVSPMLAAPTVDGDRAVQAEADAQVALALAAYRGRGLRPCVWPLLADAEGYWPSADNAERAAGRVQDLLRAAAAARSPFAPGDVVAIDLEPPLWRHRDGSLLRGCGPERFHAALQVLSALASDLRRAGLRTLAIAYPLVSADGTTGTEWQRRCAAPLRCGWDRVAVMTYSSMVSGYSRGLLNVRAARRYGYRAQRALCAAFPGQAGAFVGICGQGKLGNELAHKEAQELRQDAAAAWAAGAVEVSAFCLEGVLAQRDPLSWLLALSAPPRVPPLSLRGEAAHFFLAGLGHVLPLFRSR